MKRNLEIKARVNAVERQRVKAQADAKGQSTSDYLRELLDQKNDAITVENLVTQINEKLLSANPAASNLLLLEILLFVREIAADRNAQICARVAQQLKNMAT